MISIQTSDGTLLNQKGEVIYFPLASFQSNIVDGDNCFMCGAARGTKAFNDEHIIPNWLLRRHDLHNQTITLPNDTTIRYGQYVTPCCQECNSMLGIEVEIPVSELINQGYEKVAEYIAANGPKLFFVWLSLIFFKVHLKDMQLRLHRNLKEPDTKIGDAYFWSTMHHIHCVARSPYTKAEFDNQVIGSMLILPASTHSTINTFDYGDSFIGKGIYLKTNDVAFIAILDDSGAALGGFNLDFKRITGALSPLQLREFLARLSHNNYSLLDRPVYKSHIKSGKYSIVTTLPESIEFDYDWDLLGELLYSTCGTLLEKHNIPDKELVLESLREGKRTFLFNADGKFIDN
jgi:hypothetical protein